MGEMQADKVMRTVPKRQFAITDYFKAKPIPVTPVKLPSSKYVVDFTDSEDDEVIFPARRRRGQVSKGQVYDEDFQAPDEDEDEEDEYENPDAVSEIEDEDTEEPEEEEPSEDEDLTPKEKKAKAKAKVAAAKIIKNEPFNIADIPEGQVDLYIENVDKSKPVPKPCGIDIKPVPQDDELPPMSNLENIFHDILNRVPGQLKKFMGPQKYRKLRVATMCSGTESPLLALAMFARDIKASGYGTLEIEHVFSCEIEPYKQA